MRQVSEPGSIYLLYGCLGGRQQRLAYIRTLRYSLCWTPKGVAVAINSKLGRGHFSQLQISQPDPCPLGLLLGDDSVQCPRHSLSRECCQGRAQDRTCEESPKSWSWWCLSDMCQSYSHVTSPLPPYNARYLEFI